MSIEYYSDFLWDEERIERMAERAMDKLDHALMNGKIHQDEYNALVIELDKKYKQLYLELKGK